MIRALGVVRDAATQIGNAVETAVSALQQGRVEHEPSFTDRMLGSIEQAMSDYQTKGVAWSAKTLTDRGRNAQESRHGADLAGVLSVDLPDFKVEKGFLAQCKLIEPGDRMRPSEFDRMKKQCEKMLERTPDSFIFLYSRSGVVIVPAVSVVSSIPRNPHDFYSRSVPRFYEEHFESFIGDPRLYAPTPAMLEDLQRDLDTRRVLFLRARSE